MKKIYSLITSMVLIASVATPQTVIKGSIESNMTLEKGEDYLMDGLVWVESGVTLTVEAGAVVKFKAAPSTSDNTSALIVTRGAKLEAEGTSSDPIIFTAEDDDLSVEALFPTDFGKWGGIILLGKAPVEKKGATEVQIEGINSEEKRGLFGGTEAADNSGTLKYVSIRYTGVGLAPGNEIQGLTLGGVGSGTTIDYIDVYVSGDDGVEIFGGTVNLMHFSVAYATDDAFDFDLGYRGNIQYAAVFQRTTDDGYDYCGEWDGASPDDASLYSKPILYNATFVGPGNDATGRSRALLMRENFAGTLANSVLANFPGKGLELQDMGVGIEDSYQKMLDGELKILNNTWSDFEGVSVIGNGSDGLIYVTSKDGSDNPVTPDHPTSEEFIKHLNDNKNMIESDLILKKVERNADGEFTSIDPRTTSALGDLATASGSWFEATDYRGAFNPTQQTWLEPWSTMAKYGVLATTSTSEQNQLEFAIFPNPSKGTFSISLPEVEGAITIEIVDLAGRVVSTPIAGSPANSKIIVSENLNQGIYLVKVSTSESTGVKRIIVD